MNVQFGVSYLVKGRNPVKLRAKLEEIKLEEMESRNRVVLAALPLNDEEGKLKAVVITDSDVSRFCRKVLKKPIRIKEGDSWESVGRKLSEAIRHSPVIKQRLKANGPKVLVSTVLYTVRPKIPAELTEEENSLIIFSDLLHEYHDKHALKKAEIDSDAEASTPPVQKKHVLEELA